MRAALHASLTPPLLRLPRARCSYFSGGTSGLGSYGVLAKYKASFVNGFVRRHAVSSVVEFGCGDGNQLAQSRYPPYVDYVGFEVSTTMLQQLRTRFASNSTMRFLHVSKFDESEHRADLALSLDVIYHLVEEHVYDAYLRRLFRAAARFVIVYSSNEDRTDNKRPGSRTYAPIHVRHRRFSEWVTKFQPEWQLLKHAQNPHGCSLDAVGCGKWGTHSFASFFVYGTNVTRSPARAAALLAAAAAPLPLPLNSSGSRMDELAAVSL